MSSKRSNNVLMDTSLVQGRQSERSRLFAACQNAACLLSAIIASSHATCRISASIRCFAVLWANSTRLQSLAAYALAHLVVSDRPRGKGSFCRLLGASAAQTHAQQAATSARRMFAIFGFGSAKEQIDCESMHEFTCEKICKLW